MNDIKIKLALEFSISESDLEDGLAEYDELSVDSLISQILDKSIAVDEIICKVVEGPNNLEEVDELRTASNAGCSGPSSWGAQLITRQRRPLQEDEAAGNRVISWEPHT